MNREHNDIIYDLLRINRFDSVLLNEQAALLRQCVDVLTVIVSKYPGEKEAASLLASLREPKPQAILNSNKLT